MRHRHGLRRHAVALAVTLVLTGALAACDDPDETRVLGATETRGSSSTVTTSDTSTSSTTEPVAVSSTSATSATTTTTTTVPAPTPCLNPLVGYTVTPPAGWYPSGDQAPFAPCEAFDRRPVAAVLAGGPADDVAVVIRSLGPVHYLVDPAVPAPTARSVAPADTRLDGQVTVAGRRAARYESAAGPAGRSYTYLVDAGPTVLAAQYSAPAAQSSALYVDGKRALDQLVASLQLTAPGCLDSRDPRCGAFYTTGDPPNAPIQVTLPAQPVEAQAGRSVSFDVAAGDPDADDVRITASDSCVQIGGAVAVVTGTLRSLVRPAPASVEGRYGPWRSPPRPAGHTTLTVSRTFPTAGVHTVFVAVRSANTAFDPMLDPYSSYQECIEVTVAVP